MICSNRQCVEVDVAEDGLSGDGGMSGVDSRPRDKDGTEDAALEVLEQEEKVETNNNNNIRTHRNQKTVENHINSIIQTVLK